MNAILNSKTGTIKFIVAVLIIMFAFVNESSAQYNVYANALSTGGNCYRLTPNQALQRGAIWNPGLVSLNNPFDFIFNANFGNSNNGADGIVFVFQNVSNSINPPPVINGASIAYGSISSFSTSIGIEFDTYQNGPPWNDIADDHIAVLRGGNTIHNALNTIAGPVAAAGAGVNIEDGQFHKIRIIWNPVTKNLKVYFDCVLRINLTVDLVAYFNGNPNVYYGMMASTGGATNLQSVCMLTSSVSVKSYSVCPGVPVTLSSINNPSVSGSWSPGTFLSGTSGNSVICTPTAAMQYTFTYMDCTVPYQEIHNVYVNPVPNFSVTTSPTVCQGQTIGLNVVSNSTATTTYTWTGPGGFTSSLQSPTIANSSLPMSGIYTVSASNNGCKSTATTNVIVNPLPAPTPTNTGPYCAGGTLQLSVGTFSAYNWTGPGGFTSTVQNPTITNISVTNSGIYTVTVTNANGCVNTATTNVVVNPIPNGVAGSNSPVCVNGIIALTASGGTSYLWSGPGGFTSVLQSPSIAVASVSNSGVYAVAVNSLGCVKTVTLSVTVLNPTISATNTGPYCTGAVIQLNTSSGTSYTWSGPGGFTSAIQNPTISLATTGISGVYTVTTTIGSCTTAATTTVLVNALPVPTPTNTGPYCVGGTLQLGVGTFSAYSWSGPGGFTSAVQNPSIAAISATNAGIYTVTVTNVNGCSHSATTSILIHPLPIPVVNSPVVCEHTSIGLTATGGTAFSWTGPGGFSSNLQNPLISSASPTMTGNYTVTVTSTNGCVNTAIATVSVIAAPIPMVGTGGAVCVGSTLSLTASGGVTYNWSGPNGFVSGVQNPIISGVSLAAGGTYSVLVGANSCTAIATVVAQVNPLPVPVIITSGTICSGQALNLSGNGGVYYNWTGPGGFSSVNQNPVILSASVGNSGNYLLTITDNNGCINTASSTVLVHPPPNASAISGAACKDQNISLNASGGVSYAWTGPNGFTSNLQNPVIIAAPFSASGQYTVVVTDAFGCVGAALTSILVSPAPVPGIVINTPVCVNDILNLTATGGVQYSWSGPNGFVATTATPSFVANSVAYSGNYVVTVTDANGCSASTSAQALINPLPNASIGAANNKGCSPVCATFNLISSDPKLTIKWALGNGNQGTGNIATTCYTAKGIYSVSAVIVDTNGCANKIQSTAEVYPNPVADFNYLPFTPVEGINSEITFTDVSYGANIVTWQWDFLNTGQYTSTQQNPTFMYNEAGTYTVALMVKSNFGCSDTIVKPLVISGDFGIYVPNTFTPNSDGLNDVFQPKGFGIIEYQLQIYDRWGEKLFETNDFNEAWNGMHKGNLCRNDTYVWQINLTNVFKKTQNLVGHVLLMK